MSAAAVPSPEFSRIVDLRQVNDAPIVLEPDEAERRRLAARFGISAIDAMHAEVMVRREADKVLANGRLTAAIVQACAISGEDFPVRIDEPIALRFVPPGHHAPDEELEIRADECDEIEFDGLTIDLGEAVAQSLALAIDPFAEGPEADRARAEHKLGGDVASGPFAALAALKKKD
ncbi:DUF177 domain-containing protein [Novosphingobium sp. KCTC 2891]|uniref:YceD family protein n=1 Tax=Novosphingobium sp. KCTC 2891 TaxID=2989730 RepID=UPI0022217292|nr:DUF177 domain-containing protein [Novosphingobium sp. KCTC 2891]MCW1384042.1 DUF177 domain-containing protein [Novosphingobium sp. KCTC 2891]